MKKQIQLSIPTPCHEDWDTMNPVEKGRFCDSCQKKVIDFSNMSDREIATFFKKPSTGSVCGRFMQDQLERSIEIPKKRIPWLKYFFQITIPLFLANIKSTAQGNIVIKQGKTSVCTPLIKGGFKDLKLPARNVLGDTIIVPKENKFLEPLPMVLTGVVGGVSIGVPITKTSIINGRVVDENGEGIPYATVAIKGTENMTACDSAGNFSLACKNKKDKITLVSSSIGFVPLEKQIDLAKDSFNNIVMVQNMAVSGEVVITAIVDKYRKGMIGGAVTIKSWNSKIQKEQIHDKKIDVYPNPVKSNSSLNIEWDRSETGSFSLQLFNLSGQLIFAKEIYIDDEARVLNFQLPSVSSGNYFLRMTNKQSGKSNTEKIIIE